MSQIPPRQPLSYATPGTIAPAPSTTAIAWRTIFAAAWFFILLGAAYDAYLQLAADQDRLIESAAGLLGPFLSSSQIGLQLISCLLPIISAIGIGAIAAVALWHWPRTRLGWLALLPFLSAGLRFGQYSIGSAAALVPSMLLIPLATALLQGLCIWIGTWWGRWIFRRLASLLLPPTLAAELLPLWRD